MPPEKKYTVYIAQIPVTAETKRKIELLARWQSERSGQTVKPTAYVRDIIEKHVQEAFAAVDAVEKADGENEPE